MSDQVNAVLTAKDVEGIRERMKRIQALSKGDLRIYEHCRQVGQTLNKGQRKVERAEKKVQSLKSHAIMSEEIKTEAVAQVEVKGPEKLEEAVKAHLDGMAAGDPGFAEKLKNPKKSLKECVEYIKGEVFHTYVAKNHGSVEIATPSRAEVFGMAVHYYDEENVKIRKIGGGRPANAEKPVNQPALSEEEKEKIKKAAEDKYAAQCIEDMKKREAEKKKAEAERKKAEAEKRKAEEKARGEMSLFDLFSL